MTTTVQSATVAAQDVPAVKAAREAMDRAFVAAREADAQRIIAARKHTEAQAEADRAADAFWDAVAAAQPEDALFVVMCDHGSPTVARTGTLGLMNAAKGHREACIYTEAEAVAKMQEMQVYQDRMYPGKNDTTYRAMSVTAARIHIARYPAWAKTNTEDLDAGLMSR